jgi:hypothetical protein
MRMVELIGALENIFLFRITSKRERTEFICHLKTEEEFFREKIVVIALNP